MVSTLVGRRPLPRSRFGRALVKIADIPGLTVTPTLALGSEQGAVALDLALDAKKPTLGLGFTTRTSRFVHDGIDEANARGSRLPRSGAATRLTEAVAPHPHSLLSLPAINAPHPGPAGPPAPRP